MNKDRIDGTGKEIKGAIKEAAGKVTSNPDTQAEGHAEKIVGKVQNHIGKAEDNVKHELHKH
ncbi:MAG: CsbD family protein [Devosia sp.]